MKLETYRISARRDCFVLERLMMKEGKDGKRSQVWKAEGFFSNPLQLVLALRDLKARSIINTGEGNLIDAIKKATDSVIKFLNAPANSIEEAVMSVRWSDKADDTSEDEA